MNKAFSYGKSLLKSISPKTWRMLGAGLLLYLLPILLFAKLADEVGEHETLAFDEAVLRGVHELANPALDTVMRYATNLGYTWAIAAGTIIIVWLCLRQGKYRQALFALAGIGGSAFINLILKALFQRDRPQLWERLVTENSYSFPSGHAMASASLAMVIVVLLWPTKWRLTAIIGGIIYMVFIAFTRLYLGVHYPTDIIAGWLVTALWIVIAAAVIKNYPRKTS